jgi:hypothetical protein
VAVPSQVPWRGSHVQTAHQVSPVSLLLVMITKYHSENSSFVKILGHT